MHLVRRRVTSPAAIVVLVGVVALVAIVVGTTVLSRRAAAAEAVDDARRTTRVLATSVAQPAIPRGLARGDAGAVDRFDRAVLRKLLVPDVRRVKIWAADGTIVYSDETRLIGTRYPLGAEEQEVLAGSGGLEAEVSDLEKPENRYERQFGGLLEVYMRVRSPEGDPLLFEAYFSADAVESRRADIAAEFRPITLGSLGLVVVVATTLVVVLTRRLGVAAAERERLLRAAVQASDAERGRIARDLHDGVVQDIAGATYGVHALARDPDVGGGPRRQLAEIASTLRSSQTALRSLLVEIYPPDLDAGSLASALHDLLAPAHDQGVEASLAVVGCEDVGDAQVRLVWRVAQEAVRNALRHGDPSHLDVAVTCDRALGTVELVVRDDGRGFDEADVRGGRFGLRGLRGLADDHGGRLDVVSAPGAGTTVTLVVPERA